MVPFAGGGLRWHRHSLLRSADTVIEFMGADDGPKELSADEKEEVLYCIGLNAAQQIARQTGDLPKLVTKQEMAPVIRAIADTLLDQVEGLAADRIQAVGEELPVFLQGRTQGLLDETKAEGAVALDAAAAEEGAMRTESGLVFRSISDGIGAKPTNGSIVMVCKRARVHLFPDGTRIDGSARLTISPQVRYHGTLIDGTVFDSSDASGEPVGFDLKQVTNNISDRWRASRPHVIRQAPCPVASMMPTTHSCAGDSWVDRGPPVDGRGRRREAHDPVGPRIRRQWPGCHNSRGSGAGF